MLCQSHLCFTYCVIDSHINQEDDQSINSTTTYASAWIWPQQQTPSISTYPLPLQVKFPCKWWSHHLFWVFLLIFVPLASPILCWLEVPLFSSIGMTSLSILLLFTCAIISWSLYTSLISLLYLILQPPFLFMGSTIFIRILFSNTISFLSVSLLIIHISASYKSSGWVIVWYILILIQCDNMF